MSTEITNSFILSLRTEKEDLRDVNMDMGEIILDNLLKDDVLEKIPIFKYIYGGYKFTIGIKEGFLLKKISRFLFYTSEIPKEEKEKFISELEANPHLQSKVVEKTMIMLDKIDELNKVNILANLFKNLVAEKIDVDIYSKLLHIVHQIYLQDLLDFRQSNKDSSLEYNEDSSFSQEQGSMFTGLGLVTNRFQIDSEGNLIIHYDLSKYAIALFEYGF